MNVQNFFTELKRRNVYKVAVAYAVVAWLLIQIATQVFPFFDIPNWAVRLVVLVIIAGFPIALVIAWAFELTPEGSLKRTEAGEPSPPSTRRSHGWIYVILVAAAISVGLFFAGRFVARNRPVDVANLPAKSIAVLPFDNLSGNPDNAYFAEGIQDEILTRLAKVADLKVISRTSTQRFKSSPDNLPQIARQLGVMHILEGSVQRAGDEVRVNVQLINAATDAHLWADIYDRKITDLFAVESEVAKAISDTLQAKLTGSEHASMMARPTENADAHEFYLKGRFFWNKRTAADFKTALGYFEQAVQADPNYAVAYAGMADCYLLLPLYGGDAPVEIYPKAMAMAEKAIALDATLAEPHASLGLWHSFWDFDFAASVRELEEAIRLNPNYATAHHWLGNATLPALGRFARANEEMKRAVALDPLSLIENADAANTLWISGRAQEAMGQIRKAIQLDPRSYYPHYYLAEMLESVGDLPAAIAEYQIAVHLDDDPFPLGLLAAAQAKAGQRAAALALLQQLTETAQHRYVGDYSFALIHLALGDKDEALRWLESSVAKHQPDLNTIRADPFLRPLHGDPRFEALAEKILPAREFGQGKPPSG